MNTQNDTNHHDNRIIYEKYDVERTSVLKINQIQKYVHYILHTIVVAR